MRALALLVLVTACQSQRSAGPPNTPPPDPPTAPKEIGRHRGASTTHSGCVFALDEPFVIGNFPITRELDRFYENHEVRIREETELACKTLCAPSDTCGADGFLRKDLAHSIVCKAYRLDVQAISVGCLETTPGLPTKYHALNVRASGGTVQSFDLEAYFLADAPWPNALAEAMNRHASRKQQPLDFLALMNRTHPASKSPLFQHATFTPEAIVLTLMEGAVSGAKAGESVTVPFEELRAVLR